MMTGFRLLAKLKRLRGTALRCLRPHGGAPHGAPAHRGLSRPDRTPSANAAARRIRRPPSSLRRCPNMIRGFGHVKEANVAKAKAREAELLGALEGRPAPAQGGGGVTSYSAPSAIAADHIGGDPRGGEGGGLRPCRAAARIPPCRSRRCAPWRQRRRSGPSPACSSGRRARDRPPPASRSNPAHRSRARSRSRTPPECASAPRPRPCGGCRAR